MLFCLAPGCVWVGLSIPALAWGGCSGGPPIGSERAPERVRLQLKWKHQFQSAGYYAALAKGFYREAGLDVEIREARPGEKPIEQVLSGAADFGVGTTDLLLLRARGEPVVALAVIFQHSPLALIARADRGVDTLHDLAGRRIMVEAHSAEIFAYLQHEGLRPRDFNLLEHTFRVDDLKRHAVDAMSVYTTDEPFELRRDRIPYRLFSPRSAGIDFYGDNLFTTEQQIREHPQRVAAFRAASLRGWEYARNHPEEIVQLIYDSYSRRHSLAHLRYEAQQTVRLMPEVVETGHMYAGRWRRIAEVYAQQGMLSGDVDLERFLYDPDPRPDLTWIYITVAGLVTLLLVVGSVAAYVMRLNRALQQSQRQLHHLAHYDALTDLPNRVLFFGRLSEVLRTAGQMGAGGALLHLDLDGFKPVNDRYGHHAGDAVLREVSNRLTACLDRVAPGALVARIGGDEFAVIVPGRANRAQAAAVAEEVLLSLQEPVSVEGQPCRVGASIGIAIFPDESTDGDLLLRLADEAMYRSKDAGKNRYTFSSGGDASA